MRVLGSIDWTLGIDSARQCGYWVPGWCWCGLCARGRRAHTRGRRHSGDQLAAACCSLTTPRLHTTACLADPYC